MLAAADHPCSVMVDAPYSHLWGGGAEAGAGAMLVACRLAGLSALEGHYADDNAQAQSGVEELPGATRSSTL